LTASGLLVLGWPTSRWPGHRLRHSPEHADQPLTYDDVELDDGSTILQVRRLLDLLDWNDPPTSRPSVSGR
jgi:hypothetical protein